MLPSDFTVIHCYTRSQAIEDGMLVDVTTMAQEAGLRYPTAVSANLYHNHVVPPANMIRDGESIDGRLWDVLMVFRSFATRTNGDRLTFPVSFLSGYTSAGSPVRRTVKVLAIIHPGDHGEPVVTFMLPEDE
jgi:hypothetical protein